MIGMARKKIQPVEAASLTLIQPSISEKLQNELTKREQDFAAMFSKKFATKKPIHGEIVLPEEFNAYTPFFKVISRFLSYQRGKGNAEDTVSAYAKNLRKLTKFVAFVATDEAEYNELMDEERIDAGTLYPIGVMTIPEFEEKYREFMREVEGISEQSIISAMRGYRAFYYYCSRENKWLPEKTISIKMVEPPIKPLLTEEELDTILEKPKDYKHNFVQYRNWVIINYAYNTGARNGTMCGIKMKDLTELDEGFILCQIQKNKKPKRIYVPQKVIQILREYISLYRSDATPEDYLFCNIYGQQISRSTLSKSIKDYLRDCLGEDTHAYLHLFRHQFAAEYMKDEGSMFDLQKQLGHATLYTTKHYADKYGQPNGENIEKHSPINKRKSKVGRAKIKSKKDK